jgi:hypothetical protein
MGGIESNELMDDWLRVEKLDNVDMMSWGGSMSQSINELVGS